MMAKSLMSFLTCGREFVAGLYSPPSRLVGRSGDGDTHRGGEEGTGFELLETHGGGVGAEEEDEGHESDVWDVVAGLSNQLSFVLQALGLGERRPRGVQGLRRNKHRAQGENSSISV